MARMLLVCALIVAGPALYADEPAKPHEKVVRFHIQPMAARKPALKYHLLPPLMEVQPGNPVQGYMKAFMEQNSFFFDPSQVKQREKWQSTPLNQLPIKKYPHFGEGNPFAQVDRAARLLTPDWQMLLPAKREGYDLLLPEVQQLRRLMAIIWLRCRFQIARGNFDGAVHSLQTLFAMSQHLAQVPSWIGNLVGLAIVSVATEALVEMIQQPGCPNLYWPLTELPNPIMNFRQGTRGEQLLFEAEFRGLTAERAMSDHELQKIITRLLHLFSYEKDATVKKEDARAWLEKRAQNNGALETGRKRLTQSGLPRDRVDSFPALQVVLLDMKNTVQTYRDDQMKWMSLPYLQAESGLRRSQEHPPLASSPFADLVTFRALVVLQAQTRLQQRMAMLRHVEAFRLYAATHDGKLPAHLSDVDVPLPADPFTGKPFHYKLEGDTATLRGTPPTDRKDQPEFNVVYVIEVRR